MNNNLRNIALIPARSGSKGLIDKNIKSLANKPLIAYSIESAIQSNIFDCVHLSTDSEEYAKIGRNYGADIPFLRTTEKSSDSANTIDVVKEVLHNYRNKGEEFDLVTILQPTSPLRSSENIIKAYEMFKTKNAKAIVSVCEMEHSPLWSNTLPKDCSMSEFINKDNIIPRQMLPTYYRINGAIYMIDINFLYEDNNIYREGCYAYIMDWKNSIDIDTIYDFKMAELILNGGL